MIQDASRGTEAGDDWEAAPAVDGSRSAIAVIDFGSQYSRLIARRIRECNVYCEVLPHETSWKQISALDPRGIVLSGGPASAYGEDAPRCAPEIFQADLPLLGICYGMQLMTLARGGSVGASTQREFGPARMCILDAAGIFEGLPESVPVWMSHGDRVDVLPPGFHALAATANSPIAAMGNGRGTIGLQFHPEVVHTPDGAKMIANFVRGVCGCAADWTPRAFVEESISAIRRQVDNGRVICALSGGVDSAVAATLLDRAIGDQLICVFVDNGLLREGESQSVMETFQQQVRGRLLRVEAAGRFLDRLVGVIDPEQKRRIIGEEFIRVFEDEARKMGEVEFLAQGTLYPDVIESTSHDTATSAARIKTHHNVGGLPDDLHFSLVEPLRDLFKDEVRKAGLELGLPSAMIHRQPFPGPGLAVRVIGEVTRARIEIVRSADAIVLDEIRAAGLYNDLWQSFAILTPVQSVGVMGDHRTSGDTVAVRAVTSDDAMTADWARLPYDVLARISNRIVNEIPSVNRVVYDITSKPPATIEWE